MEYLYLIFAMSSSALLSIMSSAFGKQNKDVKNTSSLYSAIVTAAALVSWLVIFLFDTEFDVGVIPYSIGYGVSYTVAMVGMFKAYQVGSVSLTAFVKNLSLVGVAFWGFLFWKTPIEINIIIGIILIVVALYLCFRSGKDEKVSLSLKWILFASMLLVGNAGCSIIQKYQQMAFDEKYKNAFMVLGVAISFIVCLGFLFFGQRCKLRDVKKASLVYPIVGGVSSALLNLLILLLISTSLSESIIFPGIAVGGLILTILFSTVFYREKISPYRWTGLFIGAIALVFLNL
ncbi:MAG: EamA family transporter [Clostridia bacterium]|nr:EamA family transporter [Clostridia bacterium]